ncbi:MAG: undecaprenyl-diphosphate phosphatase, partial [Bacteroidetes bacterium]|nr:undecaprenyl-diphosphate phosphatase [Bacteroidota bacterium]
VHAATMFSTVIIYRHTIQQLLVDLFKFRWNEGTRFISMILISTVPVGVIGLLFKDHIEVLFSGRIVLVGSMLVLTSLLLFSTVIAKNTLRNLNFIHAFIIGISQSIAVLPGISRSGATISTALLLGVDREQAIRFSFLMVLLPILGASMLEVKDLVEEPQLGMDIMPLVAGFIAAFIAGLIACKWMIGIVKKGKIMYFSVYCLIVGTIAIISALL